MIAHFDLPHVVENRHRDNQNVGVSLSSVRHCVACKQARSLAQFWNAEKKPVYKYCKLCRGGK